ncbi:hypothetical protein [Pseudokineococcus sp. 1T1Z-3]|uniref:hypothetical protein n=1 Tax=Pseudokineococcus sp. 1T1Z-3 TaxID=3132745 RepID=UPI0030A22B72
MRAGALRHEARRTARLLDAAGAAPAEETGGVVVVGARDGLTSQPASQPGVVVATSRRVLVR